jgi:hypothetical protein
MRGAWMDSGDLDPPDLYDRIIDTGGREFWMLVRRALPSRCCANVYCSFAYWTIVLESLDHLPVDLF